MFSWEAEYGLWLATQGDPMGSVLQGPIPRCTVGAIGVPQRHMDILACPEQLLEAFSKRESSPKMSCDFWGLVRAVCSPYSTSLLCPHEIHL